MDRPVLRYFGGKYVLAPWIIEHLPKHRIYVEPYAGAASVLMQKPRSYAEVYNDLDKRIVNVFKILRDKRKAKELHRLLKLTPYARAEFKLSTTPSLKGIEAARRTIIRSFMGFGADSVNDPSRATGFRANSNRSGSTPAHDWVNYAPAIEQFTDRLMGVVIESRDALSVIKQHDTKDTCFYVDPPYMAKTRKRQKVYRYEMDDAKHQELLDTLKAVKGMVVLSGYESDAYNQLGWHKVTRKTFADGAKERTEVLYLNAAAMDGQAQIKMFI